VKGRAERGPLHFSYALWLNAEDWLRFRRNMVNDRPQPSRLNGTEARHDGLTRRGAAAGFSVWELAITVTILGIVFAMAIKGGGFVDAMRAFMTANQISRFQQAVSSYRETYNALPGDDALGNRRWGRPQAMLLLDGAPVTSPNDERIDGLLFDVLNPNGENFMAWADLRGHGALEGDTASVGFSAMPENLFGGVFGFDVGNLGQAGPSLCTTRVPGRAAEIIDERLDDGLVNRGKIVATSRYDTAVANHFNGPDADPYNVEKTYIICAPATP
jgi:hypothetical protein